MTSPIAGTWEAVGDDPELGPAKALFLFTDTHYAVMRVAKDRKTFRGDRPTEAEEAEAFRTMRAAAGTYKVSGSTITYNQELSRNPAARPQVAEITKLDDNTMLGRMTVADGSRSVEWTMRRVG